MIPLAAVQLLGAAWLLAGLLTWILVMVMPAGLPDPRPDQQYQASGAAMAPGSQTPVVRARQVIISGTGGTVTGLFVYAGTPGPGNPPVDSITRSATDPFGNAVKPDFTAYGVGGAYAQLTDGALNFQGTSGQATPAQIFTLDTAGFLDFLSGQVTGGDVQAELTLQSRQASGVSKSQVLINADQIGGLFNIPVAPPTGPIAAPASYTQTWGNDVDRAINSILTTIHNTGIW
jgi:hypothetical protein